jgi:hypothetical protein
MRELRLLDVTDTTWVVRKGGNAAISSGNRSVARLWAQAIHDHYQQVDGIWYQSANCPPARSIALNERAADCFEPSPRGSWALHDPGFRDRVAAAAGEIGYGVV